ncbi:MAG: TMEM165/GDT1 family protein [Steroidobacteraceae bacterium]|jgi:putative Ca2+/H+ antiporter (TMEM165/GDT1 family)
MEAFLVSTGIVALAEIGDKTQLLALVLAAKYRKPVPIILGILVATLVNHAVAGYVGAWVAAAIGADLMRWILGLSFIAMAAWMLVPDKLDDEESAKPARYGVFLTTFIAFFIVEIGDKTQIATVALAAKYASLWAVVGGTTLGMMLANVPAVLLGEVAAKKLPMRLVHGVAATIFLVLGVLVLLGVGGDLGG